MLEWLKQQYVRFLDTEELYSSFIGPTVTRKGDTIEVMSADSGRPFTVIFGENEFELQSGEENKMEFAVDDVERQNLALFRSSSRVWFTGSKQSENTITFELTEDQYAKLDTILLDGEELSEDSGQLNIDQYSDSVLVTISGYLDYIPLSLELQFYSYPDLKFSNLDSTEEHYFNLTSIEKHTVGAHRVPDIPGHLRVNFGCSHTDVELGEMPSELVLADLCDSKCYITSSEDLDEVIEDWNTRSFSATLYADGYAPADVQHTDEGLAISTVDLDELATLEVTYPESIGENVQPSIVYDDEEVCERIPSGILKRDYSEFERTENDEDGVTFRCDSVIPTTELRISNDDSFPSRTDPKFTDTSISPGEWKQLQPSVTMTRRTVKVTNERERAVIISLGEDTYRVNPQNSVSFTHKIQDENTISAENDRGDELGSITLNRPEMAKALCDFSVGAEGISSATESARS